MSLIQGVVGNQSNADSANPVSARSGQQGDLIVSELHGRYYEATVRGNMFGITGGLTTTTAAGAATFTGLLVVNPVGSGVNLAVNKVFIAQPIALTAETELGIMYGPNTVCATKLTTISNRLPGGRPSYATASAGETLVPAMTSFIVISSGGTAVQPVNYSHDFEGGLVIPPGYSFASYTSRVTTTACVFSFQWEEVPVLR